MGVKKVIALIICCLSVQVAAFTVNLSPIPGTTPGLAKTAGAVEGGAVYENYYVRPFHAFGDKSIQPIPVKLSLAGDGTTSKVNVSLWAEDLFGERLDWQEQFTVEVGPAGSVIDRIVDFPGAMGYQKIHVDIQNVSAGLAKAAVTKDAAILAVSALAPVNAGVRKHSFFSGNCYLKPLFAAMGIKILRWDAIGDNLDRARAQGLWIMPPVEPSMNLTEIINGNPDLDVIEGPNEPWIFGTWQGTAQSYRDYQQQLGTNAKKLRPGIRLIACSSTMIFNDVIDGWPECWQGVIDGICDHPYVPSTKIEHNRAGDLIRSMDLCWVTARRVKLPYSYITEGGQWDMLGRNDPRTAAKVLQQYLTAMIDGQFQGCCEEIILGIGDGWDASNNAVSYMTHFLEDRPVLADIWPYCEMLQGMICANKVNCYTPELELLPRAKDLQVRWSEPVPADRASDKTKVAVIWGQTGESNSKLDNAVTLNFDAPAADPKFSVANLVAGTTIDPVNGKYSVPVNRTPMILYSDVLSVIDLRNLIRGGIITGATPVNMYAMSLGKPVNQKQTMVVRIENQLPTTITGTLTVQPYGETSSATAQFVIAEGHIRDVQIEWPGGVTANENNVYGVKLTAAVNAYGVAQKTLTREHLINVALMAKKTITFNGSLADWSGVIPMTAESDLAHTSYALGDNGISTTIGKAGSSPLKSKVYLAYDDKFVYIGAWVNTGVGNSSGGGDNHGFQTGVRSGLFIPDRYGDLFNIALGFRPRVPGYGRQLDEPWAWKGHFYSSDYMYLMYPSSIGDQFFQCWDDKSKRRCGFQTDPIEEQKPLPGQVTKLSSTDGGSLYEYAIPRASMPLFDPTKFDYGRLNFVFNSPSHKGDLADKPMDDKGDNENKMHYNWQYGEFDHWFSMNTMQPSWALFLPCEMRFAIEGGVAATAGSEFFMPAETPTLDASGSTAVKGQSIRVKTMQPVGSVPAQTEKVFGRKRM